MAYYNYFAADSTISFGKKTLEYYNFLCSPSEQKEQLVLNVRDATDALDSMESVYPYAHTQNNWFMYHIFDNKKVVLRQGVLYRKRINEETGESVGVSILNLNDFKKEIVIRYEFTKADGEKVKAQTTISKKSLASFFETLILISKTTEPFKLYISKGSLKNEYTRTENISV